MHVLETPCTVSQIPRDNRTFTSERCTFFYACVQVNRALKHTIIHALIKLSIGREGHISYDYTACIIKHKIIVEKNRPVKLKP